MTSERVSSLKHTYLADRAGLGEEFKRTQDGGRFLVEHSRLIDALVNTIFTDHPTDCSLALFATGGYGRRELFPASDLDILFVFDEKEKETAEPAVSEILNELWGTGLDIGHQVWSLTELNTLDLEYYEFVLALLDCRPLGSENLISRHITSELLPAFFKANGEALSHRLVELANIRHKEFENTIYQLEPDLKTAPGGLRDLQTGRWLGRLTGAQELSHFSEEELESCETFLKRLRIFLHLLSGRNDNRLTHAMQDRVRNYVGYRSASAQSAIEALMKEYFLNARISHSFCKSMLKSATSGTGKQVFQQPQAAAVFDSMQSLLERFIESAQQGQPLTDALKHSVRTALPDLSSSLHFPSLRKTLKELFRPRHGLYHALSEMYSLGVLELLFPEFGSIKAQVVWDFYHRYTVDEHSLLAIRNIELLADTQNSEDGRFRTLLADTVDPSILTLALLFHDVGKGRGGQHSDQGARMAARALRRFRFEANEIDTIVFLIQNHLAMSSVVFRRDLEDDQVISRFADLVRDPEVLRLLTLLTYADIKAVAPGTLNEWKRDLLWQLYIASY
ncbi:MAG: [protein-PII] uridylyltransferase family protein, partial [bacterium]